MKDKLGLATTITFEVYGPIKGKARPRVVKNPMGKNIAYTPLNTVSYEQEIKTAYLQATKGRNFGDEPVSISIDAYFLIPKSYSKKKYELALDSCIKPTKKPDCDNILKIVCDALNKIAYNDDSQITTAYVQKRFSETYEFIRVYLCYDDKF